MADEMIHRKQTDCATLTPLKASGELGCSGRVTRSYSTSDTRRVTVKRHENHL